MSLKCDGDCNSCSPEEFCHQIKDIKDRLKRYLLLVELNQIQFYLPDIKTIVEEL